MADEMPFKYKDISVVTLHLGSEKIPFIVHSNRLCDVSDFFRAAFSPNFREGQEQSMNLPEDDPETFETFAQWLYGKQYKLPSSHCTPESKNNEVTNLFLALRLVILAEKYGIHKLKADVFRALLAHIANQTGWLWCPTISQVEHAYQNTCQGSSLRKFMAQWCAFGSGRSSGCSWFEKEDVRNLLHRVPDFAIDIIIAMEETEKLPGVQQFFAGCDLGQYVEGDSMEEDKSTNASGMKP